MLSASRIISEIDNDRIVIHPFNPKHLGTNSYDVTVGRYYWKKNGSSNNALLTKAIDEGDGITRDLIGIKYWETNKIHDPYSGNTIEKWGLHKALSFSNRHDNVYLKSLLSFSSYKYHKDRNSEIILVEPHAHILAYTNEFIGGINGICGEMNSRSSTRREGIDVCRCAGLGDDGYVSPWTMEISNTTKKTIIMVVGNRYAHIKFSQILPAFPTTTTTSSNSSTTNTNFFYGINHGSGKYQSVNLSEDSTSPSASLVFKELFNKWNMFHLLGKSISITKCNFQANCMKKLCYNLTWKMLDIPK
jgi:dCTP deaminase